MYMYICVCVWVCEKTETWRFNPDTQDLPEFVASENKENWRKEKIKKVKDFQEPEGTVFVLKVSVCCPEG